MPAVYNDSDFLSFRGINIQWPWSEAIINRKKVIETRTYPLPLSFARVPVALIETPGSAKDCPITSAHIIGLVIFSESFEYRSESEWLRDFNNHLVTSNDKAFAYRTGQKKFGWKISHVIKFPRSVPAPKVKGIRFTKECSVPSAFVNFKGTFDL